jgi:hypothetical protein
MLRKRKSQRGQAISEYMLTVSAVFLTLGYALYVFVGHVGEFYLNVVKLISLPIP